MSETPRIDFPPIPATWWVGSDQVCLICSEDGRFAYGKPSKRDMLRGQDALAGHVPLRAPSPATPVPKEAPPPSIYRLAPIKPGYL